MKTTQHVSGSKIVAPRTITPGSWADLKRQFERQDKARLYNGNRLRGW
jgi:hypothetical protein